jgi:Raf kinase inhibitor-like YbhB/YbcL family protein
MVRLGWALMLMLVTTPGWAAEFQLSSPTIKDQGKIGNEHVFAGFGCSGGNVSPALQWKGAPKDTRSFALTVYDPDAPTGSGWWHWIIFNLSPTLSSLPANAGKPDGGTAPAGSIQSVTDFGQPGYGGPCPPQGDKPHRYVFTLYALKLEQLPLKSDASGAMVGFYLNQNMIAKASFTAFYGR